MRRCVYIFVAFLALTALPESLLAQKKQAKTKVRQVTFEGNAAFEDNRLIGLMLTRPSKFLAKSYYYPEVFADDLETIQTFYRQNGYLEIAVNDTTIVFDTANRSVDIHVDLAEGVQTHIEGVAVFGNQFFSDSLLRAQIKLHKGEALRRRLIQESVQAILSAYAEQGYLDAAVTPNVQVNSEAHLALVDFLISEGYQSKVDSIRITGNDKTKRRVVTRELLFKPAQTIKYSRVLKSQRQLYMTGLFESAFIRPVPASSGDTLAKDILVELKERPSSEFGVMLGYGSLEKIRGQIELTTNNLAGTARQAGIVLEANFIKQGASVSFSDPWTFGTRWKTDIALYFEMRQEPGYDQRLLGARLTVGRRLGLYTNLAISFRAENTDLSHIEVYDNIGEVDPRIRTLALSLTRDTRDNLFNARSGEYFEWTNELAGGFLSGTNTFARSIARFKLFRPWGRETVVASAIDIGLMGHLGEDEEIPLSERFYTGGPTSLRGFGYQMAGPTDIDGTPQGGNFKVVWNAVEIRRTIYKAFGVAGFVDIGNVWNEIATFRIDNLRYTAGAGLRVGSPLGLLRLDYGVNLDRRGDEPRTRLFLGIGQAI